MNPLIVEVLSNIIVLSLGFVITALLLRGFLWKYLRVRASLGALVLVKIREINRDLYAVGKIEENNLIYKQGKDAKRIFLKKDKPIFYKTLGVNMIDVDSEKNAVCSVNYEAVEGFDAVKQENLNVRALQKPAITDNKEKFILIMLVVIAVVLAFSVYNIVKMGKDLTIIKATIQALNKGLVTATSSI